MLPDNPLVFDGHNDTLLMLPRQSRDFFERSDRGHIDLPRAHAGGLGGGFFAVFVPSEHAMPETTTPEEAATASLAMFADESRMPPTPELSTAQRLAFEMMGRLFRIEAESDGQVKVVRTAAELEACLRDGDLAALLHIEGAESIDVGLDALEVFYQAGLRSIGPVWSRPNEFGRGVPFKFPHSPDTGPGLTAAGKELCHACNRLGLMIDLSHLNQQGFWDVAHLSQAPLVATHSNAWTLCRSSRNLTDEQLAAIRDSDGMVGLNFHVGFLREDGAIVADTPLDNMVRHVDYLAEHLGMDRVGFGSDFDGAVVPRAVGNATGLPVLLDALREAGYGEAELSKLAHENWVRVLRLTWGE